MKLSLSFPGCHTQVRPTNRWVSRWTGKAVLAVLWLRAIGAPIPESRGLSIVPMASPLLAEHGVSIQGSSGLFVGVGKFENGSNLGSLKYAPDDAIALAHLFSQELRLLPAPRIRLALGGAPRSARSSQQLEVLRKAGVEVIGADKNSLLHALRGLVVEASEPAGLVVLSFATHGFEDRGGVYLMPSNGLRTEPATTGVPVTLLKERLLESGARKRLLLLDACRETVEGGTRGDARSGKGFLDSFARAEGFAVLGSCSARQLSWESDELQQGVFTHFFLEACRGGVSGNPKDGLLRVGDVSPWVATQTARWVRAHRNEIQEPWSEGELARQIPLAADDRVLRQLAARSGASGSDRPRREALKLVRAVQADHAGAFSKRTLDAVESILGDLSLPLATETIQRIERHFRKDNPETRDVSEFLDWWNAKAAGAAGRPESTGPSIPYPYPNSTEGLQQLFADALGAARAGQSDRVRDLVRTMEVPEPEAWFPRVFGTDLGPELATEYQRVYGGLRATLPELLAERIAAGQTVVEARRLDVPDDPEEAGRMSPALKQLRVKLPFCAVDFGTRPGVAGFTLWSFVFDNGQFRLVGKLRTRR